MKFIAKLLSSQPHNRDSGNQSGACPGIAAPVNVWLPHIKKSQVYSQTEKYQHWPWSY